MPRSPYRLLRRGWEAANRPLVDVPQPFDVDPNDPRVIAALKGVGNFGSDILEGMTSPLGAATTLLSLGTAGLARAGLSAAARRAAVAEAILNAPQAAEGASEALQGVAERNAGRTLRGAVQGSLAGLGLRGGAPSASLRGVAASTVAPALGGAIGNDGLTTGNERVDEALRMATSIGAGIAAPRMVRGRRAASPTLGEFNPEQGYSRLERAILNEPGSTMDPGRIMAMAARGELAAEELQVRGLSSGIAPSGAPIPEGMLSEALRTKTPIPKEQFAAYLQENPLPQRKNVTLVSSERIKPHTPTLDLSRTEEFAALERAAQDANVNLEDVVKDPARLKAFARRLSNDQELDPALYPWSLDTTPAKHAQELTQSIKDWEAMRSTTANYYRALRNYMKQNFTDEGEPRRVEFDDTVPIDTQADRMQLYSGLGGVSGTPTLLEHYPGTMMRRAPEALQRIFADNDALMRTYGPERVQYAKYMPPTGTDFKEIVATVPELPVRYKDFGGHFKNIENPTAWALTGLENVEDLGKTRVIYEVQSPHQSAKRHMVSVPRTPETLTAAKTELKQLEPEIKQLQALSIKYAKPGAEIPEGVDVDAIERELQQKQRRLDVLDRFVQRSWDEALNVPYQKTWVRQILGRSLYEAAKEPGTKAVALSGPEMVADRWAGAGTETQASLTSQYEKQYLKELTQIVNRLGGTLEKRTLDISPGKDNLKTELKEKKPYDIYVLKLTPEIRKRIIREGFPALGIGGLAAMSALQQAIMNAPPEEQR